MRTSCPSLAPRIRAPARRVRDGVATYLRIEAVNGYLGAETVALRDAALAAAADRGEPLPLHGVPLAIEEDIDASDPVALSSEMAMRSRTSARCTPELDRVQDVFDLLLGGDVRAPHVSRAARPSEDFRRPSPGSGGFSEPRPRRAASR